MFCTTVQIRVLGRTEAGLTSTSILVTAVWQVHMAQCETMLHSHTPQRGSTMASAGLLPPPVMLTEMLHVMLSKGKKKLFL